MSEDKKHSNEEITQAGAVELDETSLDDASGGNADTIGVKIGPSGYKFDPVGPIGKKVF